MSGDNDRLPPLLSRSVKYDGRLGTKGANFDFLILERRKGALWGSELTNSSSIVLLGFAQQLLMSGDRSFAKRKSWTGHFVAA